MEKHPYVIGPTVLTGTSEVDIGGTGVTWEAPFDGSILGIIVQATRAGIATVAESDAAVVRLKSKSAPIGPFEVLTQPINAGISTDIMAIKEESPVFPVNCPCNAGDKIQITGAELTACTVHLYVTVTIIYGDFVSGPQYFSVIGTHTSTGTAAAEAKMTNSISISGASAIVALYGETVDVTIASGKGIVSKFRVQSSQIVKGGDMEFAGEGVPGILAGATGSSMTRLTKIKDISVSIGSPATLNVYHSLGVAITAAGYFNLQVVYIK